MEWFEIIIQQLILTWRLMLDKRVPITPKIVFFLPFVYLISPIDIIPDVFLGFGQMDDIALLIAGFKLLETMSPAWIVAEHRSAIRARRGGSVSSRTSGQAESASAYTPNDNVVDAEYYPLGDKPKRKNDFPA